MNRRNRNDARSNVFRRFGSPIGATVASAALLISALGLAALPGRVHGDETKPATKPVDAEKPPKPAKTKAEVKAEKKKAQANRLERLKNKEEREKAQGESEADKQAEKAILATRPARTVTPPTLASAELDKLVRKYLTATDPKVDPAPITTDVEFVRRIYFDLTGQPPTPTQMRMFVKDTSKEKRVRLIEHLLEAPEFATNWARYWRDVIKFRATGQNAGRVGYPAMEEWLTEQFKKQAPWDQIATGLITATGRNDENGAVGFGLAHDVLPVELAGEVSRVFMGIQIQCAQCHDHKTDSWKQEQFHEFAAFFAGARQRRAELPKQGKPPVFAVNVQGKPRYTYAKLDDPKTQIPVAPKFFLDVAAGAAKTGGAEKEGTSGKGKAIPLNVSAEVRHKLVASYVTGQDNPWFAKAFVNRTWYALMGEAFYTPIDDMGPEREVKAAEVLDALAGQWQKGGYDIRWLYRTILNTETYQRRVRSTANAAGKTAFASNCPSRLRSDQIFGALAQALGFPPEVGNDPAILALRQARRERADELTKKAQEAKADAMKSGEMENTKDKSKEETKKPAGAIPVQKVAAKKAAEAVGLASQAAGAKGVKRPGFTPLNLFNILFGVDPSLANDEVLGTIPQALFMMNSPLVTQRTQAKAGTVLGQILKSSSSDREALGALYVRVLSRQPTPKEVETCAKYLSSVGNRDEAFEDIYWCLINSTEFISRR